MLWKANKFLITLCSAIYEHLLELSPLQKSTLICLNYVQLFLYDIWQSYLTILSTDYSYENYNCPFLYDWYHFIPKYGSKQTNKTESISHPLSTAPPIAKTNFDKKALQFVVPLLGLLPKEINVAGNNPPLIRVLVGPDTQYIKASLSSTDPMLPPLELGRNSLPLPNSRCLEAVWLLAEYLVRHGIFLGNYDMITQAGVISTLRIDYLFLHIAQSTWYTIVISILNVDVFGTKVSKSFFFTVEHWFLCARILNWW